MLSGVQLSPRLFGQDWVRTVRKSDPAIDKLANDGFELLTNADSKDPDGMISRLVCAYGGFPSVHLLNAYDSDGNHLPNSIGVWVHPSRMRNKMK